MTAQTRPNRFARVDETTAMPAVTPAADPNTFTVPGGELHVPGDPAVASRVADTFAATLTDDPGQLPPPDPAWATERLSPDAATLHSLACACAWGGDVDGHGVDFEELAAAFVARAVERAAPPAPPVVWPVEAKVKAGTNGAALASVGAALATLVLGQLEVIPSLVGGDRPWVGWVVLVLGAVLPPVIQRLRGYQAPHTPRSGQ